MEGILIVLHIIKNKIAVPIGIYEERGRSIGLHSYFQYLEQNDPTQLEKIITFIEVRTEDINTIEDLVDKVVNSDYLLEAIQAYFRKSTYPLLIYLDEEEVLDFTPWEWNNKELFSLMKNLTNRKFGNLWQQKF